MLGAFDAIAALRQTPVVLEGVLDGMLEAHRPPSSDTCASSSALAGQVPLILGKMCRRLESCTIGYKLLVGKHLRGGGDR